VKWSVFALVTGRKPRLDVQADQYFEIADDTSASYGQKLAAYRELADDYFDTDRYQEFCAASLPHLDEIMLDWVAGPDFDRLLVETVRAVYPVAEHDQFIAHLRGLLGLWVTDESGRVAAA
jgi:hypothetical protein